MSYTASVSTPLKQPERISRSLGVLAGKVTIDSYNSTLVEITGISRYFVPCGESGFGDGITSVVAGPSSNGYVAVWDHTEKSFKCFYTTSTTAESEMALVEAGDDDDIGTVDFTAVGFVR